MLNLTTLTLYLIAGGLSVSLSLLLVGFAHFHPGTRLLKSSAIALVLLAVGFTVSGVGPLFPPVATVVGTNMLLLSAGVVMVSGIVAYCQQSPATQDRFSWSVVALTAVPFWYWGLIEPDGHYRTAVFSFAAAIVNSRAVMAIWRAASRQRFGSAIWVLALLFAVSVLWMAVRGVFALLVQAPSDALRGANPTTWVTVFWYIVMVSMIVASVIWIELSRPAAERRVDTHGAAVVFSLVNYFRNKLVLLWATVLIFVMGMVSVAGLFYANSFQEEEMRLTRMTELANDAFVHHTLQVMAQVDTLLHAVRGFYLRTASISETESFIRTLPFDKFTIDNVYLITAQGQISISHDPAAVGRTVDDRDYFRYFQTTPDDQIFIGGVESGRVTGKFHFRVAHRVGNPDGSFGGVILVTVNPQAFSSYYSELAMGGQSISSLLGTLDKKLRARSPAPLEERWQMPVESRLWDALAQKPSGTYKSTSMVDQVSRVFAYKKVGDLPLVMVTGFSESDLRASVHVRLRWPAMAVLIVLMAVLTLATLLTVETIRLDEKDRFLSMLSHELKTPLSVLRMGLEREGALTARTRAHSQQAVQDMDSIVDRCLQVDRLQQRHYVLARQACQVADLLSELQFASVDAQRLEVRAQGVPVFSTDTQLLRIAISNLIDNALKYALAGSTVQIVARNEKHKRRAGLLLAVTNAPGSAGMPDVTQIFRKYYRSPGAHSKTGSGLGLFLVRSIARQLGGWVRLAQAPDQVRFELWIPV
jgi:signal transduction histidine kinase